MEWGLFYLALGIAFGLYCLGCGIEEAGEHIGNGLEKLADALLGDESE